MVQIENEYGGLLVCDKDYKNALRDLSVSLLGDATQLYTTDPPEALFCGAVTDVFATVDFGEVPDDNGVKAFFSLQHLYTRGGLLIERDEGQAAVRM